MTQIRWEPAQSYPDPAIQTLDPRFDRIKPPFNAAVERLTGGLRWAEGPAWFGDGRYLLCSDIPNNRIMRWDEERSRPSSWCKSERSLRWPSIRRPGVEVCRARR